MSGARTAGASAGGKRFASVVAWAVWGVTAPRGAGLQNTADRLEALGGTLHIVSTPGAGTTVSGTVPIGGDA